MNKVRAIIIGSLIWILGASFYTASYFLPFLDNKELQADLVLAIAIIPNAWLGAKIYYRKGSRMHGFNVGFIVLLTAIVLDGLITVPFFIIPYGGSYKDFFSAPSFWLIALEYVMVIYAYWRIKIKTQLTATA